jgi:hypothetical protein
LPLAAEQRPVGRYRPRLKELEVVGLISREDAPPPVATVLYELSETGLALQPVLKELGLWGRRFMTDERPEDAFRAEWLAYAPELFTTDTDPDAHQQSSNSARPVTRPSSS